MSWKQIGTTSPTPNKHGSGEPCVYKQMVFQVATVHFHHCWRIKSTKRSSSKHEAHDFGPWKPRRHPATPPSLNKGTPLFSPRLTSCLTSWQLTSIQDEMKKLVLEPLGRAGAVGAATDLTVIRFYDSLILCFAGR